MKRLELFSSHRISALSRISFLLLFTAMTLSAYGQTLEGVWTIDQIKIKKTINGVAAEKTYSTRERIESFASCPQKVTFKAGNKVVFEYSGQEPREEEYTVEGNKIKIFTAAAMLEYEFTIMGTNTISLTHSVDYVYNHDNRPTDKIKEEYTFNGNKQ